MKLPKTVLALVLSAAVSFCVVTASSANPKTDLHVFLRKAARHEVAVKELKRQIRHYQKATWWWEDQSLRPRTRSSHMARSLQGEAPLKWVLRTWKHRMKTARWYAQHPKHLALWNCIHGGEGSWTDNASHNPHWGGLQMGSWFMNRYAPKLLAQFGTANRWGRLRQLWVAEDAYESEHYSNAWLLGQWPQTAPPCLKYA